MKKPELDKKTVRALDNDDLDKVGGGSALPTPATRPDLSIKQRNEEGNAPPPWAPDTTTL